MANFNKESVQQQNYTKDCTELVNFSKSDHIKSICDDDKDYLQENETDKNHAQSIGGKNSYAVISDDSDLFQTYSINKDSVHQTSNEIDYLQVISIGEIYSVLPDCDSYHVKLASNDGNYFNLVTNDGSYFKPINNDNDCFELTVDDGSNFQSFISIQQNINDSDNVEVNINDSDYDQVVSCESNYVEVLGNDINCTHVNSTDGNYDQTYNETIDYQLANCSSSENQQLASNDDIGLRTNEFRSSALAGQTMLTVYYLFFCCWKSIALGFEIILRQLHEVRYTVVIRIILYSVPAKHANKFTKLTIIIMIAALY